VDTRRASRKFVERPLVMVLIPRAGAFTTYGSAAGTRMKATQGGRSTHLPGH
jgi:hypothetical protein